MSDRLAEIIQHKREEIAPLIPLTEKLRASALERNEFRSLERALQTDPDRLALIAEVKKASPSAGDIDMSVDPVIQARAYADAGASAISVLTDEKYFKGHLADMVAVRKAVGIPVLRKDFTVHEAQIYEACVAGADAILLIVAALDDEEYHDLFQIADGLQLDVLVEVHSLEELDRAMAEEVRILGINNRNLKTFQVDLVNTEQISEEVPDEVILLSESGIKTPADAIRAAACGVDGLLVGETLMRCDDVHETVEALRCLRMGRNDDFENV